MSVKTFEHKSTLQFNWNNSHYSRINFFAVAINRPTHTKHRRHPLDNIMDLQNRQLRLRNITNNYHHNNCLISPKLLKIHKINKKSILDFHNKFFSFLQNFLHFQTLFLFN